MKTFKQYFLQESPAIGADGSRVDPRYIDKKGQFHDRKYSDETNQMIHDARSTLRTLSADMDAEEIKQRVAALLSKMEQQYSRSGGESSDSKGKLISTMRDARRQLPESIDEAVAFIENICKLIRG